MRKGYFSLSGLAFATVASANATLFDAINLAEKELLPQGSAPQSTAPAQQANPDPTKPPQQPNGFPTSPDRDGSLPTPQSEKTSDQTFRLIKSGAFRRVGDIVEISGPVHAIYRGYDLYADRISGNTRTNVYQLLGNAKLIGADAVVVGGRISVNFDLKSFQAFDTFSELRPSLLEGNLLSSVYVRGQETRGSEREIISFDSKFTTCDYEHPHYEIDAKMITFRPGKRVILRKAKFELFNHAVLTIPYLVIPLDDRNERYAPEIGQTREEGYFIRNTFGIPVARNDGLAAYLDYFEKLGTGLGGRYYYTRGNSDGYLRAYAIEGNSDSLELVQSHRQFFGKKTLTIENNLQRRNVFNSPENTLWTTKVVMQIPQGRNQTRINYNRSSNTSDTFKNLQQNFGIQDQREFSPNTRTLFDIVWNNNLQESGSSDPVKREQLDVRLSGKHDLKQAQAELEFQRSIPIGENKNFFGPISKTPVFTLTTDSRKLYGNRYKTDFPFNSAFSIGEFGDPRLDQNITRTFFEFGTSHSDDSSKRFGISGNFRFKQGLYSDDTAQYTTNLFTQLRYNLASQSSLNLRYNYLRPEGYTPLGIDRSGKSSFASGDLTYQALRSLTISAQSGYDWVQQNRGEVAWQPVGFRAEWRPSDPLLMRAQTVYDTNQKLWSNTVFDLTYSKGDTYLSLGARYDGQRNVWGNFNLYADGLKFGRLRFATILAYNGYLKKFDSRHFSFIYDLHCAEAVLEILENNFGFRSGREIYFSIRLKAFPNNTNFGTGTQGQPIGIGSGIGF